MTSSGGTLKAREGFFLAVSQGEVKEVSAHLQRDPGLVQVRNEQGATALHIAALRGHREVVELLVDSGATVNAYDDLFAATPVGWAIEYLRELGGMLTIEIDDIAFAIQRGDTVWVHRFLDRWPGAVDLTDSDGKSLYDHALDSGNDDMVRLVETHRQNHGKRG